MCSCTFVCVCGCVCVYVCVRFVRACGSCVRACAGILLCICVCFLDFSGSRRAKGVVGKGVVVVEIAKIADREVSMVQMAVPREQTATLGTRFLLCVFFF